MYLRSSLYDNGWFRRHLGVMRTGTTFAAPFCLKHAERINSIGYDILFWEVEHINRIDGDSQEAGFKVKMRTGTSGVTTQPITSPAFTN